MDTAALLPASVRMEQAAQTIIEDPDLLPLYRTLARIAARRAAAAMTQAEPAPTNAGRTPIPK